MRDLCDDAAHRGVVRPLDRLIQLGHAKTLDHVLLLSRVTDHAPIVLDLDLPAVFVF